MRAPVSSPVANQVEPQSEATVNVEEVLRVLWRRRGPLARIEESGTRVLGIVLNRARLDRHQYDVHQGHYRNSRYGRYSRTDTESAKVSKIHEKRVAQ